MRFAGALFDRGLDDTVFVVFACSYALAALLPAEDARRLRKELGELGVRVVRLATVPDQMLYDKERLALRWSAAEPNGLQFPILDIDRAENWQQFTAALSRFPGPGSNFVYADVDGNIGYHAVGLLPKRRGWAGDVPVDGSGEETRVLRAA